MSERLFVATRKGLFTFERRSSGSPRWQITQTAFLGDPVSIVQPKLSDGTVYASLDLGHFGVKLLRSRDGGGTWEEVACPTYPPKPEGIEDRNFFGMEVPWKLLQIWSLEPESADRSDVLWCGTIPGGVFRTTDGGQSWQMMESLWNDPLRHKWNGGGFDFAGVHSILVDPRDPKRVTIGVSVGGIWRTTDGGETWNCFGRGMIAEYMPPEQQEDPIAQDAHMLVQCPAQPDAYWVQHHNGIFRSRDGGENWTRITNVEPSTFGFAVAVHPRDPDTAWFVPALKDEFRYPVDAKVVATRTRDGGETWDVLRDGLPQENAYDLTFRHALDVDPSGERVAFGSTTGGLWISEDQGDHFQCLSEHLPPIYCVRFAPA